MRRPRSAFSKLLNATHRDNRILHSIVCGGVGGGACGCVSMFSVIE